MYLPALVVNFKVYSGPNMVKKILGAVRGIDAEMSFFIGAWIRTERDVSGDLDLGVGGIFAHFAVVWKDSPGKILERICDAMYIFKSRD